MDRGVIESTANLIESQPDGTAARFNLIASQLGRKALSATESLTARDEEALNFRIIGQLVGLLPQSVINSEETEVIETPDANYARHVEANVVMSSDRSVSGPCYIIAEKRSSYKQATPKQRMFTNLFLWPASSNSPLRPHVVEVPETDYKSFRAKAAEKIAQPPSPAELDRWHDLASGKLHIPTKFSVGTYPELNRWIRKSFQVTRLAELAIRPKPQLSHVQTFDNLLPDFDLNQYFLPFNLSRLVNDFGVGAQAAELLRAEAAKLK